MQTRLLLLSVAVLAACLGSVGWLLDRTFAAAVQSGAEEELRAICYGLLGLFEERPGGLAASREAEPRLQQLGSGYYAYVDAADGGLIWRSPTLRAGGAAPSEQSTARRPAVGEFHFGVAEGRQPPQFVAAYTVNWELADAVTTLWVLADQGPYLRQLAEARRRIVAGLGTAAAVFVAVQLAAMVWGMGPLRRMTRRVRALEAGVRADVGQDFPPELSRLARNLNGFVAAQKASRERYRRAMDDLAHSLKTPLAVLTNALQEREQAPGVLAEQVERMKGAVAYQLSRATAATTVFGAERVALGPLAVRIVRALERAHRGKAALVDLPAAGQTARLAVRGDQGDVMEMLGNVVENAFKYAASQVRVSLREAAEEGGRSTVRIAVEDDGPGVPPPQRAAVLRRGFRADTASDGQGIGLAVVRQLVDAYQGRLDIADSTALGGARFVLSLPAHPALGGHKPK